MEDDELERYMEDYRNRIGMYESIAEDAVQLAEHFERKDKVMAEEADLAREAEEMATRRRKKLEEEGVTADDFVGWLEQELEEEGGFWKEMEEFGDDVKDYWGNLQGRNVEN